MRVEGRGMSMVTVKFRALLAILRDAEEIFWKLKGGNSP
jgi:hypothetical protein